VLALAVFRDLCLSPGELRAEAAVRTYHKDFGHLAPANDGSQCFNGKDPATWEWRGPPADEVRGPPANCSKRCQKAKAADWQHSGNEARCK